MSDVKTSISVGDGPPVPIDLEKPIDAPENAAAREVMEGVVREALGADAPPAAGHNSISADAVRLYVERAECLIEERQDISDNIKDVFAEAKSNGL